MIRRTSFSALVLVLWLGISLSMGEVSQAAQVHEAQPAQAQGEVGGAGWGENDIDAASKDVDGEKSAQAPVPRKTEKRIQKFVDEDGDGYNDRRPDTAPKGAAGAGNAKGAKEKNDGSGDTGVENASERGLKKGQNNNPGLGIAGALERGIKMGQNGNKGDSEGFVTPGQNNSTSNVKNNGNNRFNRNFEKYNPPSKGNMGEGSGNNK